MLHRQGYWLRLFEYLPLVLLVYPVEESKGMECEFVMVAVFENEFDGVADSRAVAVFVGVYLPFYSMLLCFHKSFTDTINFRTPDVFPPQSIYNCS